MRGRAPIRLNGGSVMITVLFVAVYMILLASLSLVTADSQLALAKRTAEQTSGYYAADTKAAEIYEVIKSGVTGAIDTEIEQTSDGGITVYRYSVPIDDKKSIRVQMTERSGSFEIDEWRLVSTRDWEPDEGMTLWSEEEIFIME